VLDRVTEPLEEQMVDRDNVADGIMEHRESDFKDSAWPAHAQLKMGVPWAWVFSTL
jgi:hypothetical protein